MNPHFFIGLPVNSALKACALKYQHAWNGERYYKRLMHPDDLHVTLTFLGATVASDARRLWKELERRLGGFEPFQLCFDRIDGFGHPRHPRVVYLGPRYSEDLTAVKTITDECLKANGFQVSYKPFHPHVTIMKKWTKTDVVFKDRNTLPIQLADPVEVEIHDVCLYRIHPGKTPSYEVTGKISGSR